MAAMALAAWLAADADATDVTLRGRVLKLRARKSGVMAVALRADTAGGFALAAAGDAPGTRGAELLLVDYGPAGGLLRLALVPRAADDRARRLQ
jgi:hypothetical protein